MSNGIVLLGRDDRSSLAISIATTTALLLTFISEEIVGG